MKTSSLTGLLTLVLVASATQAEAAGVASPRPSAEPRDVERWVEEVQAHAGLLEEVEREIADAEAPEEIQEVVSGFLETGEYLLSEGFAIAHRLRAERPSERTHEKHFFEAFMAFGSLRSHRIDCLWTLKRARKLRGAARAQATESAREFWKAARAAYRFSTLKVVEVLTRLENRDS
jgi:hypothetical protein